ncbi:MAG: TIGR02147 family protein [Fibrobacterota bacterium]
MRPIFEYLEYRDILKDSFEERKASDPQYCYRMMADTFGLHISNIYRVLQKETHLPARCQSRAIEYLGLSDRSAAYFVLLIAYARERKNKERMEILEKALALRDVTPRKLIDQELAYYRDWWVAAIRSLLEVVDGRAVPAQLCAKLSPPVPESEVVKALELLQELGLVKKAASGRLVLGALHVSALAGAEKVKAMRDYQRQILSLASESIERHIPAHRDISTITLALDEKSFLEVRELLREIRRLAQRCADETKQPTRVMQLAMALFPLSVVGAPS